MTERASSERFRIDARNYVVINANGTGSAHVADDEEAAPFSWHFDEHGRLLIMPTGNKPVLKKVEAAVRAKLTKTKPAKDRPDKLSVSRGVNMAQGETG